MLGVRTYISYEDVTFIVRVDLYFSFASMATLYLHELQPVHSKKAHAPLRINGERAFLRVNRFFMLTGLCTEIVM